MGTYIDDHGLTALLICIFQGLTPEQAFMKLEGKPYRQTITDDDLQDMIIMKNQGYTYREIGSCYGLSEHAVFRRLKSFKEKAKNKRIS